ncbi:FMN-binding protein [Kribbella sp. NPDC003557]|uniref:FMN-binding protein n=1 Tax=Kribbella sp. NPDC003557 TaxID=3154449 RepID=UPI0033BBB7AE
MRRGLKVLMTIATTAVVAVAFRASLQPPAGSAAVVGAEVVPSTRPTASPRRSPRADKSTRASRRAPSAPISPPSRSPSSAPAESVVVAGGVADTQYGPVQVEITVRSGRIVKARTLQHPSGDGQTDQINAYAVPRLDQEAMAAQTAHIDTVSGATFTSEGYRRSLQSALDAAHQAGAR